MLNTTRTNLDLTRMQLTLNNYIWGDTVPNINVTESSTDEIFNKVKPIIRKNPDPMYIYFSLPVNGDAALKAKVKDFITLINDYSTSGVYNVAPIIEYALVRDTEEYAEVESDPYLYFKKSIVKSSGGLDFTYRDIVMENLKSLITNSEVDFTYNSDTIDYDAIRNTVMLLGLIYADIDDIGNNNSSDLLGKPSNGRNSVETNFDTKLMISQVNILIQYLEQYSNLSSDLLWYIPKTTININESITKSVNSILKNKDLLDVAIQTLKDVVVNPDITSLQARSAKEEFYGESFEYVHGINEDIKSMYSEIVAEDPDGAQALEETIDKSFNFKKVTFFIRLYPRAAQIAYPTVGLTTASVSDNRLMSVINGATNLECLLSSNLALNTLDAQWLDLYANIFEFMTTTNIKGGFTLRFGNIHLHNCYFKASPRMINTGDPLSVFDLNIISTIRSLSGIVVNTYGDKLDTSS